MKLKSAAPRPDAIPMSTPYTTHRPRLITIPVVAIVTFALIAFAFHIVMHNIRAHHKEKEKKEDFQLPIPSCLSGGAINLAAGTVSLVLLFWLGDLFIDEKKTPDHVFYSRPPGLSQEDAEAAYRKSIALDPKLTHPYLYLAELIDEVQDEPEKALEFYKRYLELGGDDDGDTVSRRIEEIEKSSAKKK